MYEVSACAALLVSAALHTISPQVCSIVRTVLTACLSTGSEGAAWVATAGAGMNLAPVDWISVTVHLASAPAASDAAAVAFRAGAKLLFMLSVHSLWTWRVSASSTLALCICLAVTVISLLRFAYAQELTRLQDNQSEVEALGKEVDALRLRLHTHEPSPIQRSKSSGGFQRDILRKLKSLTPQHKECFRSRSKTYLEPPLFPVSAQRSKRSFEEFPVGSYSGESEDSIKDAEHFAMPSHDSSGGPFTDLSAEEIEGLMGSVMSHEYVLWHHRLKRPHGIAVESPLLQQLQQFTAVIPGGSRSSFTPSSLVRVPLQVLMEENEELAEVMGRLGEWDFNTLDLARCTPEPLKEVAYYLFATHSVPQKFAVSRTSLVSFLREIEKRYNKENFYHNSLHAADVLNSVVFLLSSGLHRCGHFLDLEVFALLTAAIGHDVSHPGLNNAFLVSSSDPIALRYNDKSVLEMMHAATMFRVFCKRECNILTGLQVADFHRFRKIVIDLILATDLQRHFSLQADYRRDLEESGKTLEDEGFRLSTLEICIKCADLGHGAKETSIHVQWTELISHEFFAQGDREAALGLPVSPLCARNHVDIPKAQLGFLTIMVKPLFLLWEELERMHGEWEDGEHPFELCCRRIGENLQLWEGEVHKAEARGCEFQLRDLRPPMVASL